MNHIYSRLIENAFPLIKVSKDSTHEKMCHSGHIKSIHIWPARRPLSACRAVIAATLLIDPGDAPENIKVEYEKLAKSRDVQRQRDYLCQLIGDVTEFKTENAESINTLRSLIDKTYQGVPPKLIDVFSGGGAIPFEAMRLGCEVEANDYNPVSWFILKGTLEFPFKFRGMSWPLLKEFEKDKQRKLIELKDQKGLTFHVKYWATRIHENLITEMRSYYPSTTGKKLLAYIWSRAIPCQDPKCRGSIPLMKSFELSTKKNYKRSLKPIIDSQQKVIRFEIIQPKPGEEVKNNFWTPKGTINCPFCGIEISKEYIKKCGFEDDAGRKKISEQLICAVIGDEDGKDFRDINDQDASVLARVEERLAEITKAVPFGALNEEVTKTDTSGAGRALTAPLYGFSHWKDYFLPRQMLSIFMLIREINAVKKGLLQEGYSKDQADAIISYLSCIMNKVADYNNSFVHWQPQGIKGANFYSRWAIPIMWDFVENNPWGDGSATWLNTIDWILSPLENLEAVSYSPIPPVITQNSATKLTIREKDLVVTDPPYFDVIPYADLSDFFYVLLRRTLYDVFPDHFKEELSPKDEELVEFTARAGGDRERAKEKYEKGMSETFDRIMKGLKDDGRAVFVFAHKEYDAWETLVAALINAGAIVTASWPIDTEMKNRSRGIEGASLATSIWLVCRKRTDNTTIGRYAAVKKEMSEKIQGRLRYYWDQGISGPDFVWSAIGPALESFSCFKEVKRIDGSKFTVSDFLKEVRRNTTDFALGQILHGESTEGLDEWTRYYLMHYNNFQFEKTPAGECILLSQAYGLELNDLLDKKGMLIKQGTSDFRLLRYNERKGERFGEPHHSGLLPYIDMIHRLMVLWDVGDLRAVNAYVDEKSIKQNNMFWAIVQSIVELSDPGTKERTILEAIISWGRIAKPVDTKVKTIEDFVHKKKRIM